MPILTFHLALDAPESGVELDDDVVVVVQALTDVVRAVDTVTYVVEPFPLRVAAPNGSGSVDVAAGYYWVHHPWGSKLIDLQADASLDELAAIDPSTLDPAAVPEAAWNVALGELDERVVVLEEAGPGGGAVASVDGRTGAVTLSDVYAAIIHGHAITDIAGLQAALDAKQATGSYAAAVHTHVPADIIKQGAAAGVVLGVAGAAGTPIAELAYSASGFAASTIVMRTTGGAILAGAPTAANHATTKTYVDDAVAAVGGGGFVPYSPRAAGHFLAPLAAESGSHLPPTSGTRTLIPHLVRKTDNYDGISIRVTTAEAATNIKLLLYSSDAFGHPVTLIASPIISGAVAGSSIVGIFTALGLAPGLYWVAALADSGSTLRIAGAGTVSVAAAGSAQSDANSTTSTFFFPTADVGSYASPAATLSAWGYTSSGANGPYSKLRRSA